MSIREGVGVVGVQTVEKMGRLLELCPVGTGFIEEDATGARYGFHVSMLPEIFAADDAPQLDGSLVWFEVGANGVVSKMLIK